MGMVIFTENGTFNPATYGLSAGDIVSGVVVGGGAGGQGGATTGPYSNWVGKGGDAGKGGLSPYSAGGGGGGGGGYGAGGGGGGACGQNTSFNNDCKGGDGGGAGQIVFFNLSLPNANPISITVGTGGIGGNGVIQSTVGQYGTAGGSSSFGSYITATGGSPTGGTKLTQAFTQGSTAKDTVSGGCGGDGGYIIGSNIFGGKGGLPGAISNKNPSPTSGTGNGGGGGSSDYQVAPGVSPGAGGSGGYPEFNGQDGSSGSGNGVVIVTW